MQNEFNEVDKNKSNNNNNILRIKNEGGKNFKDKEDENEEKDNKNILYDFDKNNIDSNTKLNKDKKEQNNEGEIIIKKIRVNKNIIKKYTKILQNYIILKEKINNDNNLTLYIINKIENEDIINLYHRIISNEEFTSLNKKKDSKKNKIIEDVIKNYLFEGKQINGQITVYNYAQCMNLINKIVDLVDYTFIKDMNMNLSKKNETECIKHYEENGLIFMILEFKESKKKVKIEKRDKHYFLRELVDENKNKKNMKSSIIGDDYNLIKQISSEIEEKKNNYNLNSEEDIVINNQNLIEDEKNKNRINNNNLIMEGDNTFSLNTINIEEKGIFNNKNSKEIKIKNENKKDDIYTTFKILLLFNVQNNNIILKERENDFFDENEYYYLVNKNNIINLKKEINNKNKNKKDISIIIDDYVRKNKYKKFEEFFKNIDNIIQEFEKENENLFKNEYDFKKIKEREFLPNNNKIINSINNTKIIYPLNFILIKPEIYHFFIKLISFEDESNKNNIIEPINKVSIFYSRNQIYLKNIKKEENIIYVCNIVKNDNGNDYQIEDINISYILIYNLNNTFMKEYNLFIKDNDIFNYISKRKLKANINETKKIINDENEEIGFFVNLEKSNDLILDINNNHSGNINDIKNSKIENNNNKNKEKDNNIFKEKKNYNKFNYNSKDKDINNITNNTDIFIDIDSPNNSENNIDNNMDNDNIIDNSVDNDMDNKKNENNDNIINIENNKDLIQENNNIENYKDLIQENNNIENYKDLNQENNNIENNKDLIQDNLFIENNIISNNLIENNKKEEEKIKNDENKKQILIGLINIKQDSYVTSLLQCLYNCPQLTNYFISNNKFKIGDDDNNIDNKELIENENINDENEISKNSLSYKFYEVIYHLYYKKQNSKIINSYDPNNFIEYIEKVDPTFKKINYKSPKKLFFFLINNLQKELNKKENVKDMEVLENLSNIAMSVQPNVDNSDALFKTYLNDFNYKNNSIIDKYFSGIKSSIMICEKCGNMEYSFKPFYFFNFPLSQIGNNKDENGKITLNKFFEKNYSKDKSILNNLFKQCNSCNGIASFSYSNQIFLGPKLLVFIIEDAKENGDLLKLNFNLDINEYLIEKNNRYELIGFITYFKQKGMNASYIAYCKIKENGKWYCCCDDYIYEVEENDPEIDINKNNYLPYILFYNETNNT